MPSFCLFYANWCPHCQHFKKNVLPKIKQLRNKKYPHIFIQSRDTDIEKNQIYIKKAEKDTRKPMDGIPALYIYCNGKYKIYNKDWAPDIILKTIQKECLQ